MAVPDFQTIMLPLLKFASDKEEHRLREAIEHLAQQFKLSESERKELLPSGTQARFGNRVGWASTYLRKAGLLESTDRGRFHITMRGIELLSTQPQEVNLSVLEQYPAMQEFRNSSRQRPKPVIKPTEETPKELLERTYQELLSELATDLLNQVKACPPSFFEQLVVDLLVAMGYGGSRTEAGKAIGRSGDEGIDGTINEDKLGLDVVYIQAKRWEKPVGRPVVQAFAGSLEGAKARKGVLITTSRFSNEAYQYVRHIEKRIILVDGAELSKLMIDHDIGVTKQASYVLKKINWDYFEIENG